MPAARFVTDAALDRFARRLRFLGYDVVTHRGVRLEELFELAARDGRIVLTTSPRHPRRYAAIAALQISAADEASAIRRITAEHEAASEPFTRCPRCNTAMIKRSSFEARGEVPGRVTRSGSPLRYCPACGKWYWIGSHVAHIAAWLEAALGRPVAVPQAEPPGRGPAAGAVE